MNFSCEESLSNPAILTRAETKLPFSAKIPIFVVVKICRYCQKKVSVIFRFGLVFYIENTDKDFATILDISVA